MKCKEKFELLETNKEWDLAIELIKEVIQTSPDCIEAYIRAIYMFHHILLEEIDYPKFKKNELEGLLTTYFVEANKKFFNYPEYLFFVGEILYIAEWFFDVDDDLKPLEDRKAFKMQKQASELEPGNILYEWAYRTSLNDDISYYLAHLIIRYDQGHIDWLKSKGFPGGYILRSLNRSNKKYLNLKS